MSGPVVETHGLRRRFGAKLAVADLSLSIGPGEVFGFLGPNGAGKTTSLKMLLGLIAPSAGRGTVLGAPLGDRAARRRLGFLPEHFRFPEWLSARELLRFHGELLGLGGRSLDERAEALLSRVNLLEAAGRPLREYSKGMMQRAGLAAALLGDPALVFLDEPTSGLDPIGRRMVRDIIRDLRAAGTAVFLNSHLLGEVEATCDRVAFLKQGRVVQERVLGEDATGVFAELRADGLDDSAFTELARFGHGAVRDGALVRLRVQGEDTLPEIARWAVGRGLAVRHLGLTSTPLEALFVEIMGDEQRPG